MSRLISNKTKKIELGDDEYIEVKQSLAYCDLEPIMIDLDQNNATANIKMAIPLLKKAIVSWKLKDEDGKEISYSEDKINLLDTTTVTEIISELIEMYFPQKKLGQIRRIIEHDSRREKAGYAEVMDLRMSEQFGLRWKEHDHLRMQTFIRMRGYKKKEPNSK